MARVKVMSAEEIVESITLDTLIPRYAENKSLQDDYKKICDEENKQIKELMTEQGLDKYETGGYKVSKSVQNRDNLNEDKVLANLDADMRETFEQAGIIKIKEYIDTDNLESLIYSLTNKDDDKSVQTRDNLVELLDRCTDRKEVVTLRVTKVKEKKNG